MTDKIKRLLAQAGIESYLINEECKESCELYFVRRRLDQKRACRTNKATVTVYRDTKKDGADMRGAAQLLVFSDMTDDEIMSKLSSAYSAAQYSYAPSYPLCEPTDRHKSYKETPHDTDLEQMAKGYAEAVFKYDTDPISYVNCAEIFCKHIRRRISNSCGVDVSFTELLSDGELVVTSKDGEDSELFDYFSYTGECYSALSERVRALICAVRDRAHAVRSLRSGEYDLIVDGECCRELFEHYLWKANAKNIHTGYSDTRLGDSLAPEGGVGADITALATVPFDSEGIPCTDTDIVRGGMLCSFTGDMRFSSYVGAKPTGSIRKIDVKAGTRPLSEIKKEPYLYVFSFSDFQFDPLDGYFGGEIRLAYLFDGVSVQTLTGGSVSSNISKLRDSAEACSDIYESSTYKGPLAIKIKNVTVAKA